MRKITHFTLNQITVTGVLKDSGIVKCHLLEVGMRYLKEKDAVTFEQHRTHVSGASYVKEKASLFQVLAFSGPILRKDVVGRALASLRLPGHLQL